jgi:acetyl/propionyl-CoA carboxylase alpha subunit
VRVDSGVVEGADVPVQYDPLIAKVIVSGETRPAAIDRAISALRRFPVLGLTTNIPFLLKVLEHPRFRSGDVDTGFVDAELEALLGSQSPELVHRAMAVAVAVAGPTGVAAPGDVRAAGRRYDPWSSLGGGGR